MMIKRILAMLLILLLPAAAAADPLLLTDDLAGSVSEPFYDFSYRYPQADPSDPGAPHINSFYSQLVNETLAERIPSASDYYSGIGQHMSVRIDYEITCSSAEFFSVRLHRTEESRDGIFETWTGNTFSLLSGMPGQTSTLSHLLGILNAGETDDWLQERQASKVLDAVCGLVWERITANPGHIAYYDDITAEDLAYVLNPEEDFWLDETGNPVFYIQPGEFADFSAGLLTFSVSLEEIDDEI